MQQAVAIGTVVGQATLPALPQLQPLLGQRVRILVLDLGVSTSSTPVTGLGDEHAEVLRLQATNRDIRRNPC